MPDNTSDILGKLNSNDENIQNDIRTSNEYLRQTRDYVNKVADTLSQMSQESARSYAEDRNREQRERREQAQRDKASSSSYKSTRYSSGKGSGLGNSGKPVDDFLDSLEEQLVKNVAGSDFQKKIKDSLSGFADNLGVELEDIPGGLGRELADSLSKSFQGTSIGRKWSDSLTRRLDNLYDSIDSTLEQGADTLKNSKYFGNGASRAETKTSGTSIFNEKSAFNSNQASSTINIENANLYAANMQDAVAQAEKTAADSSMQAAEAQQAAQSSSEQAAAVQKEAVTALSEINTTFMTTTGAGGVTSLVNQAAGGLSTNIFETGMEGSGIMSALSQLASSFAAFLPELAALAGLAAVVGVFKSALSALSPITESLKDAFASMKNVVNSQNAVLEKETENLMNRMSADIETMIRYPFEIMEDAAQEAYDVWDSVLREVNATQGYTKADLQDLMASYSQRLQAEGLSAVVSSTEITENLTKVLEAGLSGTAAEEFAYLATVLNAAIPTEDFFNYADTYAQLATIAIQNGYSESEAISYANDQLESFASNILYASRELSGGFTTGLSNASDLMASAVSIAQSAGSSNYSEIGAVLAATSSYVGSIAPALESSMTDLITQLATGGNSSQLTALRSLAGTGASNTAFLNAFAANPQEVLYTLFSNLGSMQNMSSGSYMEVAESLSDLFGISMDALSQIDFQYLANAISEMTVNSDTLTSNLDLLASGETTTSAEEQRMAQINEYMSTEGLSYVLDNEAARAVQQHLWDQEIADQIMESDYAVDFTGAALTLMQTISKTINNILAKLIPSYQINQLQQAYEEQQEYLDEIDEVLESGRVASDITDALNSETDQLNRSNLTNYRDIINDAQSSGLSGFFSRSNEYSLTQRETGVSGILDVMNNTASQLGTASGSELASSLVSNTSLSASADKGGSSRGTGETTGTSEVSSMYQWSTVSKNVAESYNALSGGYSEGQKVGSVSTPTSSASDTILSATEQKLSDLLSEDRISAIVASGGSYEDVKTAAATEYGIADLSATLSDLGYNEDQLIEYMNDLVVQISNTEQARRDEKEEAFWDSTLEWFDDTTVWREEVDDYWRSVYGDEDGYWQNWFNDFQNYWKTNYETDSPYWKDWFNLFDQNWQTRYSEYLEFLKTLSDQTYWKDWFETTEAYWEDTVASNQSYWEVWFSDANDSWNSWWTDTNESWISKWDEAQTYWQDANQTWTEWWQTTNDTWTEWWQTTNDTWTEWWTDTFYNQMLELWNATNDTLTNIYVDALGESSTEDSVRHRMSDIYDDALGPQSESDSVRQKLNDIYDDALGGYSTDTSVRKKINDIYSDALGAQSETTSVRNRIGQIYNDALGPQSTDTSVRNKINKIYDDGLGEYNTKTSVRAKINNIYDDALGPNSEDSSVRSRTESIYNDMEQYLKDWEDYYIGDYTHYYESVGSLSQVSSVQSKQASESADAVYALASVLTQNSTDLKDPAVQTNVLLAQILQVVAAIMEQTNDVASTTTLADSLSGLALGLVNGTSTTEESA